LAYLGVDGRGSVPLWLQLLDVSDENEKIVSI
jgi:hypothetical protein